MPFFQAKKKRLESLKTNPGCYKTTKDMSDTPVIKLYLSTTNGLLISSKFKLNKQIKLKLCNKLVLQNVGSRRQMSLKSRLNQNKLLGFI